ncbi:MAG: GNAT family N-acetyltransferase [Kibdelosporangium sp.]
MRTTVLGLPVAIVDVEEALTGVWRQHRFDVDVVRIQDPPPEHWTELTAAGFLPKPQVITWRAATGASEQEFLAKLSGKDRQNIRTARRRAETDALSIKVVPVDAALLDVFLPLYEAEIARMQHGWAAATEHRDKVLAEADRYFAVCISDGDTLVAASVNEESRLRDEVRARFSVTVPDQRQASLARVLYLEVVRVARQKGFRWVSLGSDPNLYGHVAKPGLFGFKNRLGFVAVPSHVVDPTSGSDQADRIVRLGALTDPTFVLAYAPAPGGSPQRGARLRLELFSSDANIDTRPYTADYLAGTRIHRIGRANQ